MSTFSANRQPLDFQNFSLGKKVINQLVFGRFYFQVIRKQRGKKSGN